MQDESMLHVTIQSPRVFPIQHNKKKPIYVNPLVLSSVSEKFKELYFDEKKTELSCNDHFDHNIFIKFIEIAHFETIDILPVEAFQIRRIADEWKAKPITDQLERILNSQPEASLLLAQLYDEFTTKNVLPKSDTCTKEQFQGILELPALHQISVDFLAPFLLAARKQIDINEFVICHIFTPIENPVQFIQYLNLETLSESDIDRLDHDSRFHSISKIRAEVERRKEPTVVLRAVDISEQKAKSLVLKQKLPYFGIFASLSVGQELSPAYNGLVKITASSNDPSSIIRQQPFQMDSWVQIQLPKPVSITNFKIQCSSDFKFYGSTNRSDWTQITSNSSPPAFSTFKITSTPNAKLSSVEMSSNEYPNGVLQSLDSVITASDNSLIRTISPRHKAQWYSIFSKQQYIQFEFCQHLVIPELYTIKSGRFWFMKTWDVLGSLDGKKWKVMDSQDTIELSQKFRHFTCRMKSPIECRFIRIVQKGKTHDGMDVLCLSGVEFFGKIRKYDQPTDLVTFQTDQKARTVQPKHLQIPSKKASQETVLSPQPNTFAVKLDDTEVSSSKPKKEKMPTKEEKKEPKELNVEDESKKEKMLTKEPKKEETASKLFKAEDESKKEETVSKELDQEDESKKEKLLTEEIKKESKKEETASKEPKELNAEDKQKKEKMLTKEPKELNAEDKQKKEETASKVFKAEDESKKEKLLTEEIKEESKKEETASKEPKELNAEDKQKKEETASKVFKAEDESKKEKMLTEEKKKEDTVRVIDEMPVNDSEKHQVEDKPKKEMEVSNPKDEIKSEENKQHESIKEGEKPEKEKETTATMFSIDKEEPPKPKPKLLSFLQKSTESANSQKEEPKKEESLPEKAKTNVSQAEEALKSEEKETTLPKNEEVKSEEKKELPPVPTPQEKRPRMSRLLNLNQNKVDHTKKETPETNKEESVKSGNSIQNTESILSRPEETKREESTTTDFQSIKEEEPKKNIEESTTANSQPNNENAQNEEATEKEETTKEKADSLSNEAQIKKEVVDEPKRESEINEEETEKAKTEKEEAKKEILEEPKKEETIVKDEPTKRESEINEEEAKKETDEAKQDTQIKQETKEEPKKEEIKTEKEETTKESLSNETTQETIEEPKKEETVVKDEPIKSENNDDETMQGTQIKQETKEESKKEEIKKETKRPSVRFNLLKKINSHDVESVKQKSPTEETKITQTEKKEELTVSKEENIDQSAKKEDSQIEVKKEAETKKEDLSKEVSVAESAKKETDETKKEDSQIELKKEAETQEEKAKVPPLPADLVSSLLDEEAPPSGRSDRHKHRHRHHHSHKDSASEERQADGSKEETKLVTEDNSKGELPPETANEENLTKKEEAITVDSETGKEETNVAEKEDKTGKEETLPKEEETSTAIEPEKRKDEPAKQNLPETEKEETTVAEKDENAKLPKEASTSDANKEFDSTKEEYVQKKDEELPPAVKKEDSIDFSDDFEMDDTDQKTAKKESDTDEIIEEIIDDDVPLIQDLNETDKPQETQNEDSIEEIIEDDDGDDYF